MGGAPDSSLSPGFGGFLVFFVLALVLWLLMRSMGGVLRRMQYREEAERERAEGSRETSVGPGREHDEHDPGREDDQPGDSRPDRAGRS